MRGLVRTFVVLSAVLLVPASSFAQQASIAGVVKDASGAVLPGVSVEATSSVLTEKVRARMARLFKHELKACAAQLGGPAKEWPARYGFSLVLYFWDLLDDSIDLFFWCDWIC